MHRRDLLTASGLLLAGTAAPFLVSAGAKGSGVIDAQLSESLQACTPEDALTRLLDGNRRFVRAWAAAAAAGTPRQRMDRMNAIWRNSCQIDPVALARGQKPFAAVLSCADARVDPNWVFASGSGELFQVRSAGNTAFDDAVASLEYAVSVLGTPLVLVLGHSSCGAVKAAMASDPLTPLLEQLVKPIRASLQPGWDLTQAIQANVRNTMATLTRRSALLQAAASRAQVTIRGALFDIGSGRVTLL